MRKIGFVLALLSALSMTAAPAISATASSPAQTSKQTKRATEKVAMLLPNQLDELARLDPALHDKVMKAKTSGKNLVVSPAEGAVLAALSQKAEDEISAGAVDWLIVTTAVVAIVSYIITYASNKDPNKGPFINVGLLGILACGISMILGTPCLPPTPAPAPR